MFVDRDAHSSVSNSSFSGADGSAATTPRGDTNAARPRRRRQSDLREVANAAHPHVELRPTPRSITAAAPLGQQQQHEPLQQSANSCGTAPFWPDATGFVTSPPPPSQPMNFASAAGSSAWGSAGQRGVSVDARGGGGVQAGHCLPSTSRGNHGKSAKAPDGDNTSHNKGRAGGGVMLSSASSLKNFEFSPIQGQRSHGAQPTSSLGLMPSHTTAAMPGDQRRSIQAWVDLNSGGTSLPATSVLPSRASSMQATVPLATAPQPARDSFAEATQAQALPPQQVRRLGTCLWGALGRPLWEVVVYLGSVVLSVLGALRLGRQVKDGEKMVELSLLWGLISVSLPTAAAAGDTGLSSWVTKSNDPATKKTGAEHHNVKEGTRCTCPSGCGAGGREAADESSRANHREEGEEVQLTSTRRALRKMELRLTAVQSTLEETSANVRSLEGIVGGLHHLVMSHDAALQRD